ncbi:MAG: heme o synthase [Gammaproteobacteria bacterium]|nr:heme o synthase [Gammaproteobacteria bacterium]
MSTSISMPQQNHWLHNYYELCKPRVVMLIVFTAVVGMLLADPDWSNWPQLLAGMLGITLASASGAALNHLLDQRIDIKMLRTQHRPLPQGQTSANRVLAFAITLGVLSMLILGAWVNPLTAVLSFFSLIGYGIIYTLFLKWATPQNIVIGGLAGAAPPLLGWTTVTGTIEPHALLLVLIVFVWTPPHFWALAIYRRDDYAKAAVPMLPVTHGIHFTRWQILFYTILLFVATIMPWLTHMSGLFYLGGALVLNIAFMRYAIALLNTENELLAMRVFNYSIFYLMALFAFLLGDHYLLG